MKLSIVTIALDAEPFIEMHLPVFVKLKAQWHWYVVHGAANNGGSTKWCRPQEVRLSVDGTTEYLAQFKTHPRITVIEKPDWSSKDEMFNAALLEIKEPCTLVEIDADEVHTARNLATIAELFDEDQALGGIRMRCRYFVGPNLVCEGDNCWSNQPYEWDRAWRFEPGMEFVTHEPPKLNRMLGRMMDKDEASSHGLLFDHHAYATLEQVKYKQEFYNYSGLVNQWQALQANKSWPAKLARFFPFAEKTMVDRY